MMISDDMKSHFPGRGYLVTKMAFTISGKVDDSSAKKIGPFRACENQ